jgi:hypothetical protein
VSENGNRDDSRGLVLIWRRCGRQQQQQRQQQRQQQSSTAATASNGNG